MANRFLSIGRGFSWRCPLWSTSGKTVGFGFPIHGLWPCPISWDFCRIYIYIYIIIYIIIYIYNIYICIYYIYTHTWVNDDTSPTWNLRPSGWFPESDFHAPAAPSTKRIRVSSNKNLERWAVLRRWAVPWTPVIFWIFENRWALWYDTRYYTISYTMSI